MTEPQLIAAAISASLVLVGMGAAWAQLKSKGDENARSNEAIHRRLDTELRDEMNRMRKQLEVLSRHVALITRELELREPSVMEVPREESRAVRRRRDTAAPFHLKDESSGSDK